VWLTDVQTWKKNWRHEGRKAIFLFDLTLSISLALTSISHACATQVLSKFLWKDADWEGQLLANYWFNGTSGVTSPKFWEGPSILTVSEQNYFVWYTGSQSTKRQDMQEILGAWLPFCPLDTLKNANRMWISNFSFTERCVHHLLLG